MRILRSSFVVRRRITGGWIIGTRAMYEYAATIMGARNCDFSLFATTIAVGPSAAPIIAMDAASL